MGLMDRGFLSSDYIHIHGGTIGKHKNKPGGSMRRTKEKDRQEMKIKQQTTRKDRMG
jgi:hypothetical protein